jgi:hypothetical protein
MILSALGQFHTVLVLGLPLKGLIPFRESIFHINTSYNPYLGNVGRHTVGIPKSSVCLCTIHKVRHSIRQRPSGDPPCTSTLQTAVYV